MTFKFLMNEGEMKRDEYFLIKLIIYKNKVRNFK